MITSIIQQIELINYQSSQHGWQVVLTVGKKKTRCVTLLFCSSLVKCSKQLLLRKMACRTGLSEHRNMSLIVSEMCADKEWIKNRSKDERNIRKQQNKTSYS